MIWLDREDNGDRIMVNSSKITIIQPNHKGGSIVHLGNTWTYFVEVRQSPMEIDCILCPDNYEKRREHD